MIVFRILTYSYNLFTSSCLGVTLKCDLKINHVHPSLGNTHRVSFGSSKGSMVETLIYDSPLSEHEPTPFGWRANKPHRSASHQFRTTLSPTLLPEETQLLLSG